MVDIRGKSILILGGLGMVGTAIARDILEEGPSKVIVAALRNHREEEALLNLKREYPTAPIEVEWGNIFVRASLKDKRQSEILADPVLRIELLADLFEDLSAEDSDVLNRSALYQIILAHEPHIIIDCINTATIIAYQNVYDVSSELITALAAISNREHTELGSEIGDHVHIESLSERLLSTLYIPALVRHIQILFSAMQQNNSRSRYKQGTQIYVKVGTTGTGGMGLNIPYTHSEDKPSRVLLSKSAVAGAHTMLLFLMGRTPHAPIIKEVKPAAAIAWALIKQGPIARGNQPLILEDCPLDSGVRLEEGSIFDLDSYPKLGTEDKPLESVYVDTGENGVFAREEFAAITSNGQMEFVTPEDVAHVVLQEILGANTGHDIVGALDSAVLPPSYRAGTARHRVLERMDYLSKVHNLDSVAFELLGPPRLSKLLFEGWLLKNAVGNINDIVNSTIERLVELVEMHVKHYAGVRQRIISVGIPILLSDGRTLLRGTNVAVPKATSPLQIGSDSIDQWAHQGWVDLRPAELRRWQQWLSQILSSAKQQSASGHSGSRLLNPFLCDDTWQESLEVDVGEVVGWIFREIEGGNRIK